jgi:FkbM family methyltransferase
MTEPEVDRADILARLDKFTGIQREVEEILQTLVLNDSTIIDALAQMFGLLAKLNSQVEQSQQVQARLSAEIRSLIAGVAYLQPSIDQDEPIVVATDKFSELNPEIALLQHLCPYVDDRTAVDIGAHVGEVAGRLLDSGWRIHAFEPYPPSFEALEARLGGKTGFTALPIAIGAADGEGSLHIAQDVTGSCGSDPSLFNSLVDHPLGTSVKFVSALPVQVRSLAGLRATGELPKKIGLLKIDSEGADVDVIKGMGTPDVAIVMAEYWDVGHAFGQNGHGHLGPLVEMMRGQGYFWHVVFYHLDQEGIISYYFNHSHTIPGSWGNAVFFRDRSLFARAARWCEAALLPTLHR